MKTLAFLLAGVVTTWATAPAVNAQEGFRMVQGKTYSMLAPEWTTETDHVRVERVLPNGNLRCWSYTTEDRHGQTGGRTPVPLGVRLTHWKRQFTLMNHPRAKTVKIYEDLLTPIKMMRIRGQIYDYGTPCGAPAAVPAKRASK